MLRAIKHAIAWLIAILAVPVLIAAAIIVVAVILYWIVADYVNPGG